MNLFFNSDEFIYIYLLLFFSVNDYADESFLDDTFLIDEDDFALLDDLIDGYSIDDESFVSTTDTITSTSDSITSSVTNNSIYCYNNVNCDNHNHDHDVNSNNNVNNSINFIIDKQYRRRLLLS
jgi:hypothetical protein